jgi:hypothetical protein
MFISQLSAGAEQQPSVTVVDIGGQYHSSHEIVNMNKAQKCPLMRTNLLVLVMISATLRKTLAIWRDITAE